MPTSPEPGMRSCLAKQLQRVLSTQKRCVSWYDSRKGDAAAEGRRPSRALSRPGHIVKVIRRSLVLHPGDADDLSSKFRAAGFSDSGSQDSMFSSAESLQTLASEVDKHKPPPEAPYVLQNDEHATNSSSSSSSESQTLYAFEPAANPTSNSHKSPSSNQSLEQLFATHHTTTTSSPPSSSSSSSIYLRKTEIIIIPQPQPQPPTRRRTTRKLPPQWRRRKQEQEKGEGNWKESGRARRASSLRECCKALFRRLFAAPSPFLLATMA
ncbi:hypothetical protein F4775DRAFT_43157 [Biscogniauxia sp. FL1348]|nr:hypothetical protein F4775DRAFT_43157 [Biscogniauxia sp. FL1348]